MGLAAAFLFGVHPLAFEAIIDVSSQSILLAAFLCLLSRRLFLFRTGKSTASGDALTAVGIDPIDLRRESKRSRTTRTWKTSPRTERHLLYVACTRARDHLLVTGVDPASEFLDDLEMDG